MAVCTYANYDKNIFKIEYPSELFLSNVAAAYFNESNSYIKIECFIKNLYGQTSLETIRHQLDLDQSNK
ncbi:hypothetical protein BpHYR1_023868 [Brachionus plicatilis]|uniref:Uncharacterized protein n=1 Tax=Brachionus plicatilis TaxID=10195 RepID=A0A3M7RNT4_BRAPC|nr:hypothetical protein BpHYR1_023868 [Brachionus plicatilis]